MNDAVVRTVTAGLVRYLSPNDGQGPVVIGYDARHSSDSFAREVARVVAGSGRKAILATRPLPTPVIAYAVRALRAAAGVVITASHNPKGDNGYKVYLSSGLPLGSVEAEELEAAIDEVEPSSIPRSERWELLDDAIVDEYIRQVVAGVRSLTLGGLSPEENSPPWPALRVAYTPLHGVGADIIQRVFETGGLPAPMVVPTQADPDPDFPTTPSPNPELPGVLDQLLRFAAEVNADIAIANDPDADRCAVAISSMPGSQVSDGPCRVLTGDEVGVLLADMLMRRGVAGTYAATVASSSQLEKMCRAHGFPYAETLTGFKWIMRAADDLVFGYEEALGYSLLPSLVGDKDGISAALAIVHLAQELVTSGKTLSDRLDELNEEYGRHVTMQVSVKLDPSRASEVIQHLRANPPSTLAGQPITAIHNYAPASDLLVWHTSTARVAIRPSGTEPLLKAYLEVVDGVPSALAELRAALSRNFTEITGGLVS